MIWDVLFHNEFDVEYRALPEVVQDELLAKLSLLRDFGPSLGRPTVDTLKASKFPNMKELRFIADGVWRFAFAFDPERRAIVLVGGNKEGANQRAFYRWLLNVADQRFAAHLATMESAKKRNKP